MKSADAKDAEKRTAKREKLEGLLRDQAAMGNIKGACENSPFIERDMIKSANSVRLARCRDNEKVERCQFAQR
jgi:hypothetical protein